MILNFVLFQLGWLASVLGAARGMPWLGVVVVATIVTVHLLRRGTPREPWLVGASALAGGVIDSSLASTGVVVYASPVPWPGLAPIWIVAMWANFAITIRHAMAWLAPMPWLAAGLGAVFGPLAYWGAFGLGAASFPSSSTAMAALAVVWGASLPILFELSRRLR